MADGEAVAVSFRAGCLAWSMARSPGLLGRALGEDRAALIRGVWSVDSSRCRTCGGLVDLPELVASGLPGRVVNF